MKEHKSKDDATSKSFHNKTKNLVLLCHQLSRDQDQDQQMRHKTSTHC